MFIAIKSFDLTRIRGSAAKQIYSGTILTNPYVSVLNLELKSEKKNFS